MHARWILVVAVSLLLASARASAESPCGRELDRAVEAQDEEIARSSAKAVVAKAESKVSRNPGDVTALFLLGRAYGAAGDAHSAVKTFHEVTNLAPDCAQAFRARGVLYFMSRERDPKAVGYAEADLRRAISIDPRYAKALQDLGELLTETKRYDEAIRMLQRALDVNPANETARIQIVRVYFAWERPAEALQTLDAMPPAVRDAPGVKMLRARALTMQKKYAEAQALAKRLAIELPDRAEPLREWLNAAAQSKTMDPEEGLWVLERLRRLTKGDEQTKIGESIDQIHKQMAARSAAAAGPVKVTPDLLARMLRAPDAKVREGALLFLLQTKRADFHIGGDLFDALFERLKEDREPAATNRMFTLAIFERWGDPDRAVGMASRVRPSLYDRDARVRARAADTLAAIRSALPVPFLSRLAVSQDKEQLEVATAARMAIYYIAKVVPPSAETTPVAQAAAFATWWKSEDARPVKLAAIDAIARGGDYMPEQLLYQMAIDEDPAVWPVAYRALAKAAKGAPPDRAGWMATLPPFADDALVAARRDEVATSLGAWWLRRPK